MFLIPNRVFHFSKLSTPRKPLDKIRQMSQINYPKPLVLNHSGDHKGTIIFLHGLGDSGYGWEDAFDLIRKRLPGLKIVLPHA